MRQRDQGQSSKRTIRGWLIPAAIGVCCAFSPIESSGESSGEPTSAEHFDRIVAPIFSGRCLECHSGPEPEGGLDLGSRSRAYAGGESGPSIIPGKPEESPLWEKLEQDEMPPKHPLPAREKAILKRWIEAGGVWGTEVIDRYRYTSESRAGYDWWSLQPLREAASPEVDGTGWGKNEIDGFILSGLKTKNLKPAPPAGPRELVRRLYFDLTGLPPTPEAVDSFQSDPSDEAYEALVDRLLASPQYGERWGQHWLDVVRYGESGGFERNEPRTNSWYYRDWVIRSLNADLPYDEFVRHQLAGDLLIPGIEGVSAAGFLVAGVHNTVVGSSERMRKLARQDELEELAGTLGQTFLGLTVNCARCHDHKFDPIPSREYYRFISALDGINHGEREVAIAESRNKLLELQREIDRTEVEAEGLIKSAREVKSASEASAKNAPPDARKVGKRMVDPIASWNFDLDLRDQIGTLHGEGIGGAKLEGGALVVEGKGAYVRTAPLTAPLVEKTLEAWVLLDNLEQQGGGVISVETNDGGTFDAIVYGEQEARRWMAGSDSFSRTQSFQGGEEREGDKTSVHIAITYTKEGVQTGYRDGISYGHKYQTGQRTFAPGESHVAFGIRHLPAGGNRMLSGRILQANLYDRALTAEEIADSAAHGEPGYVSEGELVASMTDRDRTRYSALKSELDRLRGEHRELEKSRQRKVYTVVPGNPEEMRVHVRGDVTKLGEAVSAGGIAAVGGNFDFKPTANAPVRDRRLALSDWITDPQNGLFHRVIVNRLWHYHFGTGIVQTPNDFGFNGGRPSHPELLDWLAGKLRKEGMRWKPIHRLIVLSATYRQSSILNPEGMKVDSENRLLWRAPLRRLEGESLRDSMLSVAGILNLTPGGPGYQDVTVTPNNGTTYYEPIDQIDPLFQRRTIYRFVPRGGRSALLDSFDCPDPSVTAPRRQVTTTPLQALSLMNNPFVLEASEKLALRAEREAGPDPVAQIDRMWKLTTGRSPDVRERELSRSLVQQHGASALGRALFNSNEFVLLE